MKEHTLPDGKGYEGWVWSADSDKRTAKVVTADKGIAYVAMVESAPELLVSGTQARLM